jgi:hypothetical protein
MGTSYAGLGGRPTGKFRRIGGYFSEGVDLAVP